MAIGDLLVVNSFSDIAASEVNRTKSVLEALWASADPNLDVRNGSLSALVVRPAATLMEVSRLAFEEGRQQSSLRYLIENPSDRSSELLDELASNYRIVRRAGAKAYGTIRLIFSAPVTLVVSSSDVFSANAVDFRVANVHSVNSIPDLYRGGSSDHFFLNMPDDSGYVYFDVPVTADVAGAAGNIIKGTEFTLTPLSFPNFIRAVAAETFTGGINDEGDNDLIQRMLEGISAKVLCSRTNMKASLALAFPDIRGSFIAGAGDAEMTRDKHSVFPGSVGGYVDWYIATTRQIASITTELDVVNKTADNPDGSSRYSYLVTSSDIPCLCYVTDVIEADTGKPCRIVSQDKMDISNTFEESPMIYNDEEACYSAYHAVNLVFDASPDLKRIHVSGIHMPQINDIQEWVRRKDQAPVGIDILVKAAVPVAVHFSAILNTNQGQEIDLTSIQSAVADHINGIAINGPLSVSSVISTIHSRLPAGSYLTDYAMFATIYLPSGPVYTGVADRFSIDEKSITNRNVVFYCDPADVTFSHRLISE